MLSVAATLRRDGFALDVAFDAAAGVTALFGPSGAGKSDLALRLIDRGAKLIADDRVDLVDDGNRVVLSAPARIKGLIEVRGLGILRFANVAAPLVLAIELVGAGAGGKGGKALAHGLRSADHGTA